MQIFKVKNNTHTHKQSLGKFINRNKLLYEKQMLIWKLVIDQPE